MMIQYMYVQIVVSFFETTINTFKCVPNVIIQGVWSFSFESMANLNVQMQNTYRIVDMA